MKTVKHYKSFDIQAISKAISQDVHASIKAKENRELKRRLIPEGNDIWLNLDQTNQCKQVAFAKVIGELQTLLTIAIMELKHKETPNSPNKIKVVYP